MSDFPMMARYYLALGLLQVLQIPQTFRRKLDFVRRGIHVARGTVVQPGSTIGNRTRINAASHLGHCDIGKHCAIGGCLVVRSENHRTDHANMQSFAQRKFLKSETSLADLTKRGVKIGDNIIAQPGVKVEYGAVIGAGSVVTKPIPAYAVAVGNAVRVIKTRIPQARRQRQN